MRGSHHTATNRRVDGPGGRGLPAALSAVPGSTPGYIPAAASRLKGFVVLPGMDRGIKRHRVPRTIEYLEWAKIVEHFAGIKAIFDRHPDRDDWGVCGSRLYCRRPSDQRIANLAEIAVLVFGGACLVAACCGRHPLRGGRDLAAALGRRFPAGPGNRNDYATERVFLRKVGGGYIFIHRTLMEHFASMYENETAMPNNARSAAA